MGARPPAPRLAVVDDADEIARLLHDFNTEFATPTPGVGVLASRLRGLLRGPETFAIVADGEGGELVALALLTLRPNVWYDGWVALLDELYVVPSRRNQGIGSAIVGHLLSIAPDQRIDLIEINVDDGDLDAQRFYERHGFTATEPSSGDGARYWWRELVAGD